MIATTVHAAANGRPPEHATVADVWPRRGGLTIHDERYLNETAAVKAHPARTCTGSDGADCVTSPWRGEADEPTRARGRDAGRRDHAGGTDRVGDDARPRTRRARSRADRLRHRAGQRDLQRQHGSRSQLHRSGPYLPDRRECGTSAGRSEHPAVSRKSDRRGAAARRGARLSRVHRSLQQPSRARSSTTGRSRRAPASSPASSSGSTTGRARTGSRSSWSTAPRR